MVKTALDQVSFYSFGMFLKDTSNFKDDGGLNGPGSET
jgi:hypothetical protein